MTRLKPPTQLGKNQKIIKLSDLAQHKTHTLKFDPNENEIAELTETLAVQQLSKFRCEGSLKPIDNKNWRLKLQIGTTIIQECVISFKPIKTRINVEVVRNYLARFEIHKDAVSEMDANIDQEAMPVEINLLDIACESLALDTPSFPRHPDAELQQKNFAEPGIEPLTDEDLKPFAKLAELRDKLS